jgi:hypothetical protein
LDCLILNRILYSPVVGISIAELVEPAEIEEVPVIVVALLRLC